MYGLTNFLILTVFLVEYTRAQPALIAFESKAKLRDKSEGKSDGESKAKSEAESKANSRGESKDESEPLFLKNSHSSGLVPSIYRNEDLTSLWFQLEDSGLFTAQTTKEFTTMSIDLGIKSISQQKGETIIAVAMSEPYKAQWWLKKTSNDEDEIYYCIKNKEPKLVKREVVGVQQFPYKILKIFATEEARKITLLFYQKVDEIGRRVYIEKNFDLKDPDSNLIRPEGNTVYLTVILTGSERELDYAGGLDSEQQLNLAIATYDKKDRSIRIHCRNIYFYLEYKLEVEIESSANSDEEINCNLAFDRYYWYYTCNLRGTIIFGEFEQPKRRKGSSRGIVKEEETLTPRIFDIPKESGIKNPIPLYVKSEDYYSYVVLYNRRMN